MSSFRCREVETQEGWGWGCFKASLVEAESAELKTEPAFQALSEQKRGHLPRTELMHG